LPFELIQEGGGIHPAMIGITGSPGKCRATHFELSMVLDAYQRPREKKPSSASTRITMRMIQRMLMRFHASLVSIVDLHGLIPRGHNEKPAGPDT
jgi:hypothetical protein